MNGGMARLAMLVMWGATVAVRAEDGLGIGVIVGEPTGVTVKKWIDKEHAVDAAAAWSFSENESFQFHADYLVHKFGLLTTNTTTGSMPLYFGVGARVKLESDDDDKGSNNDDALVGVRIPFGVSLLFTKAPVDLFAEIVPILDVVPDTDLDINAAIGARFYFR